MAKQKRDDELSGEGLEWFSERLTQEIASRLQGKLREIVRDEMKRAAAAAGTVPR